MPLRDVANNLSDLTGVKFAVQLPAIQQLGSDDSMRISLNLRDAHLSSVLQALEDLNDGLQFVARDYGILITNKDYARDHGYMPVLEMNK